MTLDGTNTWVVLEPGSTEAVVVDPGPLDEAHLAAVLGHVAARGARVALTLLTHGHHDHAESADRFAELWEEWRGGADGVLAGLASSADDLRSARDDVSLADTSSSDTHSLLSRRLG